MPKIPRNKTTPSHTTLTETAREVIEALHKIEDVSKVSIGIIKTTSSKGGKRGIKFLPITGGLKAAVRGSGTVQELYIYTKNSENTEKALFKIFK
ncbi:MAG: DUF2103 domain-containing protein [bacterium]